MNSVLMFVTGRTAECCLLWEEGCMSWLNCHVSNWLPINITRCFVYPPLSPSHISHTCTQRGWIEPVSQHNRSSLMWKGLNKWREGMRLVCCGCRPADRGRSLRFLVTNSIIDGPFPSPSWILPMGVCLSVCLTDHTHINVELAEKDGAIWSVWYSTLGGNNSVHYWP